MGAFNNSLFHILRTRIRQFGGWRVVSIYARNGALCPMIKAVLRNPFSRQSYKKAYSVAVRKTEPVLRGAYVPLMHKRKTLYDSLQLEHDCSKIVWFCWLQGMENAPLVIKVCYESLIRNLKDREIRVIDEKNWKEFVQLPDFVVQKWEKKQIPPAHLADLLRLELLIQYGGTWIDSTVLCTGLTPENEQETMSFLDADLFMFQYTRPGSNQWGGIGNWFISSCTNNVVLMVLRDLLCAYWKDHDCLVNYYIFHLFFSMLREVYPKEVASMPYGYAMRSIALVSHWAEPFDQDKWDRLTSRVCFHKLAYSVKKDALNGRDNYYQHIINQYNPA